MQAIVSDSASSEQRELTFLQELGYALPVVSVAFTGGLIVPWLTYFYVPPGNAAAPTAISAGQIALVMFLGRVVDAIVDPVVGQWSDHCTSALGRRRPFMLYGTPLLALSFAALWMLPRFSDGPAAIYAFALITFAFWAAFTAVVGPHAALLPEIVSSSRQRVRLSSFTGSAMLLGTIASAVLAGSLTSNNPEGMQVLGATFHSALEPLALVGALSFFLFLLPPLLIKERSRTAEERGTKSLFTAFFSVFSNEAFCRFIAIATFVQMGLICIITAFPYVCSEVLERAPGQEGWVMAGRGEAWTGYLMGGVLLGAALWIPLINRMTTRWSKKRIMLAASFVMAGMAFALPTVFWAPEPALPMVILSGILTFPAACSLVLINPMYADVVDEDTRATGKRREGLYTGAMSVFSKASIGIGNAVVILLVGQIEGTTGLFWLGPIAGASILVGAWLFRRYPLEA